MKKLLKCSISAGAVVALAGSVHAIPTLVVEDGNAAFNTIQTSASGVVTITTSDANWSVVVATGTSSPPIPGGNPATPVMDILISALYTGSGSGNPLIISFANDGFGPTSGSFIGELTGQVVSGGFANVGWTIDDGAGSHLPTIANPIAAGLNTTSTSLSGPVYANSLTAGPVAFGSSYTLGEEITLTGNHGSFYNIDASLQTTSQSVPDGGTTLILLASALSGLGFLKKMKIVP
jgi:hypothetical protein